MMLVMVPLTVAAEPHTLSLDSCKARALRANKQLAQAREKHKMTEDVRKATRTKYLPQVDVTGGYLYSSRELSLLSDEQKSLLSTAGTNATQYVGEKLQPIAGQMGEDLSSAIQQMAQQGVLTTQQAEAFGNAITQAGQSFSNVGQTLASELAAAGDAIGQQIVDAFHTDTHHMFTASAIVTLPVYMGGAITIANNIADISAKMADTNINATEDEVLYNTETAYWTVVSLKQKQRLADNYLALVERLESDVKTMIREGVATRADGLKVSVAVNEADMTKAKVDNGLALAKMYLCQLCGMDMNSDIILDDEDKENLDIEIVGDHDSDMAFQNRPDLRMLEDAVEITRQQTRLARATMLPQVALMTGTTFSNPSVYNGFERKFKGAFNIGVLVRIPVLDWGATTYNIRAARHATTMAELKVNEAQEQVELQINQCTYRVRESNKNLATAKKNIERAVENLRCANLGFKEGVMQTTDVMQAQTAWVQAQSQKIDAEINVKLSNTALKKALGEI